MKCLSLVPLTWHSYFPVHTCMPCFWPWRTSSGHSASPSITFLPMLIFCMTSCGIIHNRHLLLLERASLQKHDQICKRINMSACSTGRKPIWVSLMSWRYGTAVTAHSCPRSLALNSHGLSCPLVTAILSNCVSLSATELTLWLWAKTRCWKPQESSQQSSGHRASCCELSPLCLGWWVPAGTKTGLGGGVCQEEHGSGSV